MPVSREHGLALGKYSVLLQPHLSRRPRLPTLPSLLLPHLLSASFMMRLLHSHRMAQLKSALPLLISQSCREECAPGRWSPASLCYMRDVWGGHCCVMGKVGRAKKLLGKGNGHVPSLQSSGCRTSSLLLYFCSRADLL